MIVFFKKIPKYSHKNVLSYDTTHATYAIVYSTTFNLDHIRNNDS